MNIIEKLENLHEQALTEYKHYYTANIIQEAIEEIKNLQQKNKIKGIVIGNYKNKGNKGNENYKNKIN